MHLINMYMLVACHMTFCTCVAIFEHLVLYLMQVHAFPAVYPSHTKDVLSGIELFSFVTSLTYHPHPRPAHDGSNITVRCIAELDEKHKVVRTINRTPSGSCCHASKRVLLKHPLYSVGDYLTASSFLRPAFSSGQLSPVTSFL